MSVDEQPDGIWPLWIDNILIVLGVMTLTAFVLTVCIGLAFG